MAVRRHPLEQAVFFGVPIAILVLSYVAICFEAKTAWPWLVIVHESGDKTLLDTLLYFDHAARELSLDLVLGAAVAGAMVAHGHRRRSVGAWPLMGWVIVVAVIIVGTQLKVGTSELLDNLGQRFTRPGAEPIWGAHWRYHLLSRFGLILAAWCLVELHRVLKNDTAHVPNLRPFLGSLAAFFVLSLLFIPSTEPFVEPRFLGHQAREAMTHAIVTLPLSVGLCLAVSAPSRVLTSPRVWPSRRFYVIALLSAAAVLYVGLGAALADATDDAQTNSPVKLVAVHFFEHGFTYLVTPLFSAWLFGRWTASK